MVPRTISIQLTVVASVPCNALINTHSYLTFSTVSSRAVYMPFSHPQRVHPPTSPLQLAYPPHPSSLISHFLRIACPDTSKSGQVPYLHVRTPCTLLQIFKRLMHPIAKNKVPNSRSWGMLKALKKYLFNKQT